MKLPGSPFFWVCFAMLAGGMSTALISPLYPFYQTAWDLPVSQVSLIYVIYMLGSLSGLLLLGRLPDRIGVRKVLIGGLSLVLIGTLFTALAWDITSLSAARFIVGVAASMLTTAGSTGLLNLTDASERSRVSMITSVLLAVSFGLGPLLGGVVGQWISAPLISAYLPVLLLGCIALAGLLQLPPPNKIYPPFGLKDCLHSCLPKLTWPGDGKAGVFLICCMFSFVPFGVFGMYAAMAPLFLEKIIPWDGPIVSGGAIASILFTSALVQLACSRLHIHVSGAWGMLALAASNAAMLLNFALPSGALFAAGVLLTATGHGMTMLAGTRMVNQLAGAHNRSGMLASFWVIGYIGAIVPMLAMGWAADLWGLPAAVSGFCVFIVVLATSMVLISARHSQLRPNT